MGLFDFFRRKPSAPAPIYEPEPEPFQSIEPPDVEGLRATGARLIDVRTPGEYAGYHIPGAELVPLDQLRRDPSRFLTEDNIIFVCEMGSRSAHAAEIAAGLGFTRLYNLEGGTQAWMAAGFPTDEGS